MAKGLLMNDLLFPIYLIEDEDVMIFPSIRDVQMQLEPNLIRGDEIAYDAKGRRLKIETDRRQVKVSVTEEDPMHAAELEASLRSYLIAMKEPLAKEARCNLPCLVNLSIKYISRTHTVRDLVMNLWDKIIKLAVKLRGR